MKRLTLGVAPADSPLLPSPSLHMLQLRRGERASEIGWRAHHSSSWRPSVSVAASVSASAAALSPCSRAPPSSPAASSSRQTSSRAALRCGLDREGGRARRGQKASGQSASAQNISGLGSRAGAHADRSHQTDLMPSARGENPRKGARPRQDAESKVQTRGCRRLRRPFGPGASAGSPVSRRPRGRHSRQSPSRAPQVCHGVEATLAGRAPRAASHTAPSQHREHRGRGLARVPTCAFTPRSLSWVCSPARWDGAQIAIAIVNAIWPSPRRGKALKCPAYRIVSEGAVQCVCSVHTHRPWPRASRWRRAPPQSCRPSSRCAAGSSPC